MISSVGLDRFLGCDKKWLKKKDKFVGCDKKVIKKDRFLG